MPLLFPSWTGRRMTTFVRLRGTETRSAHVRGRLSQNLPGGLASRMRAAVSLSKSQQMLRMAFVRSIGLC